MGDRGRCVRMFECCSKTFQTRTHRFLGSFLMDYPMLWDEIDIQAATNGI